jgi:hypothetical protein
MGKLPSADPAAISFAVARVVSCRPAHPLRLATTTSNSTRLLRTRTKMIILDRHLGQIAKVRHAGRIRFSRENQYPSPRKTVIARAFRPEANTPTVTLLWHTYTRKVELSAGAADAHPFRDTSTTLNFLANQSRKETSTATSTSVSPITFNASLASPASSALHQSSAQTLQILVPAPQSKTTLCVPGQLYVPRPHPCSSCPACS